MTESAIPSLEQYWRDPEAFTVPRVKPGRIKAISNAWLREYYSPTTRAMELRWAIYWISRGLVYLAIRKHANHRAWLDIESAAYDALWRAIDGFNPAFGFEFTTYSMNAVIKSASPSRVLRNKMARDIKFCSFDPELDRGAYHDAPYIADRAEIVCAAIDGLLDARERDILRRRFGIGEHIRQTLREVGVVYSLAPQRVQCIERAALRRLRPALARLSA